MHKSKIMIKLREAVTIYRISTFLPLFKIIRRYKLTAESLLAYCCLFLEDIHEYK